MPGDALQQTKAQLAATIDELTAQIATANLGKHTSHGSYLPTHTYHCVPIDREANSATLAGIQATLEQQTVALNAAQARAAAAEAQAAAAQAAAAQAAAANAAAAPQEEPTVVPKPAGSRFNIRNAMDVSYNEYCAIRVRT